MVEVEVENNGDVDSVKLIEGYFCVVCNEKCTSKTNLSYHIISHFYTKFNHFIPQDKPFCCRECGLISRDKISLIRHYSGKHKYFEEITGLSTSVIGLRKVSVKKTGKNNWEHMDIQEKPDFMGKLTFGERIQSERKRKMGYKLGLIQQKYSKH